ncbi:MAG: MFS transporter, partial [Planctomycetaceae bacterium]|nr:MFS transporter [Planctomycetaceae bacterium]
MKSPSSQLCLIATSVFLGLSLWFSTSAVGPEIEAAWGLNSGQVAWLTMAVQLGFVLGTLLSAILNLPDRIPAQWLIAGCAALGGLVNLVIALGVSDAWGSTTGGFNVVVTCRLAIGMTMAGIYPPGMKLVASWFSQRRGLAIGVVVGALTVGSASPHLLLALPLADWLQVSEGALPLWRLELLVVSAAAGISSL